MKKYIVIILALFLFSCEQYFIPDIDSQESILNFEGFISDQSGAHVIKISKSISYNEDSMYQYISGFNVVVEDDLGGKIQFNESKQGNYTSDSTAKGLIGNKYRMVATSPEGKTYVSSWELLERASSIDDIYGAYNEEIILRYREEIGYVEERIAGINVLNDVSEKGNSMFYRYEYAIVYQSINTYPTTPFVTVAFIARPVRSKYQDFISTVNANLYTNSEIKGNKVCFISEESMHYRVAIDSLELDTLGEPLYEEDDIRFQDSGFLIELYQYSLSEKGFKFWDDIYKQSNSSGQIFDAVDTQIKGNITNLADSNEVVFGYFGASAITKKAMFLKLEGKKVKVEPVIYFPYLTKTIVSYTYFDFWVK